MKSSIPRQKSVDHESVQVDSVRTKSIFSSRLLWTIYVSYLLVCDAYMIVQAFRLAFFVRFELSLPFFEEFAFNSVRFYSGLSTILVPLWLIIFASFGLYRKQNLLGGVDEYQIVGRSTTIGMLLLIVFGFLEPAFIIARGWVLLAWCFSFLFVAFGRFLLRRGIYLLRRRGYFVSPAVIVGANEEGLSLAHQLMAWRTSGLVLVGFIDKKIKAGTTLVDGLTVLGTVEKLDEIIEKYGVEELILASSAISTHDKLVDIFQRYGVDSDVNVRMSSGLYEILTTGLTVKEFAYVPLVGVNKVRLTGINIVVKTIFDYCIAIPVSILSLPLLSIISLLIKLDSPGPVIYRRRVMGVNGKEFNALKFRTMRIDGEEILSSSPELREELATNHKIKNDPRVTRVGLILRKLSLDELPQLYNVIAGQMSLVGPRMISPREMKKYHQWGINLLTVKPGITGLWQVSGRSDIGYEERVRLDMHYIRNWSIWLDLQLLWRTIPVVLLAHGAY